MAILSVKKIWSLDGSRESRTGRLATEGYEVLTDGEDVDEITVLLARDPDTRQRIPRVNDFHPSDPWRTVESREARLAVETNPYLWRVTVIYETLTLPGQDNPEDPPWEARPEIWFDWISSEEPIDQAYDVIVEAGDREILREPPNVNDETLLIANSSDEPFEPPIAETYHDPIMNIRRYEERFDPSILLTYRHKTNDRPFFGAPAGYALLLPIQPRRVHRGELSYWEVHYRIHFRDHRRRVADMGTRQKVRNDQFDPDDPRYITYQPIRDADGEPVTKPVPLDGDGGPLQPGRPPVWLRWRTKERIDFSPLNLLRGL